MIVQTIQLALAPVFVLVAIGNILNLLSTRLSRVVDRARKLQELHVSTAGAEHDAVVAEMRVVDRRIVKVAAAIRMLVLAALLIGVTVATLFLQGLLNSDWHGVVAITFLGSVLLLLVGLVMFLQETQIAASLLRIPTSLLELDRDL